MPPPSFFYFREHTRFNSSQVLDMIPKASQPQFLQLHFISMMSNSILFQSHRRYLPLSKGWLERCRARTMNHAEMQQTDSLWDKNISAYFVWYSCSLREKELIQSIISVTIPLGGGEGIPSSWKCINSSKTTVGDFRGSGIYV